MMAPTTETGSVRVTYRLTAEDWVEVNMLHSGRGLSLWCYILGGFIALASLSGFVSSPEPSQPAAWVRSGVLAIIFLSLPSLLKFWFARDFGKQPTLQGEWSLRIDDSKVTIRTPVLNADSEWEAFTKWRDSKRFILLYQGPRSLVPIPKKVLEEGQEGTLRDLLSARLGPPK